MTERIQAETKEQAIEKTIEQYKEGALVLSPGCVQAKRIHFFDDDSDRWIEF